VIDDDTIVQELFPDIADELSNVVDLTWREGAVVAARVTIDPSWVETQLKKFIKPFLADPFTATIREIAFLYEDGVWWESDARKALEVLAAGRCAPSIERLTFSSIEEHFNNVDGFTALPASLFERFALSSLHMNATLVTAAPLPRLKRLERNIAEITTREFVELTRGAWSALETLHIHAGDLLLGGRGEEPDEDLLAELRAGFDAFLTGEHFPSLREFSLRVPELFQRSVGDLRSRIEGSPLGKRLGMLDVQTIPGR
jgi:hypothetical protein